MVKEHDERLRTSIYDVEDRSRVKGKMGGGSNGRYKTDDEKAKDIQRIEACSDDYNNEIIIDGKNSSDSELDWVDDINENLDVKMFNISKEVFRRFEDSKYDPDEESNIHSKSNSELDEGNVESELHIDENDEDENPHSNKELIKRIQGDIQNVSGKLIAAFDGGDYGFHICEYNENIFLFCTFLQTEMIKCTLLTLKASRWSIYL